MEYGQHDLVFEFTLSCKPPRLLPLADAPSKGKDNVPKELFTLETVVIQEGIYFGIFFYYSSYLFCLYL